jgi:uncharacterized membrane protein YhhN
MQTLCVVLGAAFVAGLLYAERTTNRTLKYVCKPLASVAFVSLGAWNLVRGSAPAPLDVCILAGLVLGAAGDVCLMLPGTRWFLTGLFSFLLGHLAYTAGFFWAVAPARASWMPALLGTLLAGLLLKTWWTPIRGKRLPVIAYAGAIVLMVTAAAGLAFTGRHHGCWFLSAATLFAVSDVAVMRERFVKRSFVNKAWGLPMYYAAQLLLASCIGAGENG